MSYVIFEDDASNPSAQEVLMRGQPFWPLVRQGHFGAEGGDSSDPKPLGILGVGTIVSLPSGALVQGTTGGMLHLVAPCRFQVGKATASYSNAAAWEPSHTDVMFDKDVSVTALDPISAVPVPGGGTFNANAGWHGLIPAGVEFSVAMAGVGSDPRFAQVMPAVASRWSPVKIGLIIAGASAIVVVGLFAATLTLGKRSKDD